MTAETLIESLTNDEKLVALDVNLARPFGRIIVIRRTTSKFTRLFLTLLSTGRISVLLLLWMASFSFAECVGAATWHVDPVNGNDDATGDQSAPFRSLMRACKLVNPGDTVLACPGVYFEHVKLERAGTAAAPITFHSTAGSDQTIVTGAWKELREGRVVWQPVEAINGLYRLERKEEPATILCDELNLYRYPSLDELKRFTVDNVAGQKKPGPGPKHGFAWAEGWLYVRLHPDGRDGDTDPNAHQFKVSPARGAGFRGDEIDARQRANFLTVTNGPAYVVVDGFTFESPGFCGVWIRHGQVTVKNCRFIGCRTGVRGWDRAEKQPRSISDDVVVERCEFSEHPMFADVAEIIDEVTKLPETERESLARFYWWHRKGGAYSSELGLVTAAGRRWMIRRTRSTTRWMGFRLCRWAGAKTVWCQAIDLNASLTTQSKLKIMPRDCECKTMSSSIALNHSLTSRSTKRPGRLTS